MKYIKVLTLIHLLFYSISALSQVEISSEQLKLDTLLNTQHDEGDVVISPDGKWMLFSRSGDPENKGDTDIWISKIRENGYWGQPVNVTNVNKKGVNQPIGFVADDRVLVFVNGDLKTYLFDNGKLSVPREFMVMYFRFLSEHLSGNVSADGKILLFGMESFGSYGVEDIYVTKKRNDDTWTTPKNLSQTINTDHQEINPFLAPDNKTLFFASNGHGGEGSFDIFMSIRTDETWQNWTKPVNLGSKINTPGRESSFKFNLGDEYGYVISTQNSEGYGDIKRIRIKPDIEAAEVEEEKVDSVFTFEFGPREKMFSVSGKTYDKNSGDHLVGAEVLITSTDGEKVFDATSNSSGLFKTRIVDLNDYYIKISRLGYMSYEIYVTADDLNTLDGAAFSLEPLEVGNTVSLEHVLFEQGTPVLLEDSYRELDLVVEMMKLNPEITIFLGGHTDNQGKFKANLQLSEDRVNAVTQYLVSHGISNMRISGRGYGSTKPRASNAGDETRKLNRRVEFTILKK